MAILNFPNTRQNGDPLQSGDQYTGDNQVTYIYDGVKWVGHSVAQPAGTNSISNNGNVVQVDSSGALIISGDIVRWNGNAFVSVLGGGNASGWYITSATSTLTMSNGVVGVSPGTPIVFDRNIFGDLNGASLGSGQYEQSEFTTTFFVSTLDPMLLAGRGVQIVDYTSLFDNGNNPNYNAAAIFVGNTSATGGVDGLQDVNTDHGSVRIQSYNTSTFTANTWTFAVDGSLTLPGSDPESNYGGLGVIDYTTSSSLRIGGPQAGVGFRQYNIRHAIAIGNGAQDWATTAGNYSIAIGSGDDVGFGAKDYSICIGTGAGYNDGAAVGLHSIAIGHKANYLTGHDNSITLNATGNELNIHASGFYVKPVREDVGTTAKAVFYNTSTGELTYTDSGTVNPNIWVQSFLSDQPQTDIVQMAISVEYDADNNIIALFDHVETGNNDSRYYSVGKFTPTGTRVWTARFTAGFYTDGWGLAVEQSSGAIYVTGSRNTDAPGEYTTSVLVKLNGTNGQISWAQTYDFGYQSNIAVVDVASDGNPVMVGYVNDGTAYISTTKVDMSNGAVIWTRKINGQADEQAHGMAVGPSGEVVVVGYLSQLGIVNAATTLYSDPVSNNNWTVGTTAYMGGVVFTVDITAGVPTFSSISDTVGNRTVDDVLGALAGNVLGGQGGTDNMTVKVGSVASDDNASDRIVVVKYASDGTIAWQKAIQFDEGWDCNGADADIDSDGNIYVCGSYNIPNQYNTTGIGILKLDSAGVKQWSRRVVGPCVAQSSSIVVGPDNKLYISAVTIDPTPSFKWVVAKYGFDGSVEWQKFVDNTTTLEIAGTSFNGNGGGSNLAVNSNYVALGGGFGDFANGPTNTNIHAVVAQVPASGTAFVAGDWDFTDSGLSGTLNSSASDVTVVAAQLTDSDNTALENSSQSLNTDNSNFLVGTVYHAGIQPVSQLASGSSKAILQSNGTLVNELNRNLTGELDGRTDSGGNFGNRIIGIKNASGYKRLVELTNSAQTWFDLNDLAAQLNVPTAWIMGVTIEYQTQSSDGTGSHNGSMTGQIIIASSNNSGRDISVTHSEAVLTKSDSGIDVVFANLDMWRPNGWTLQAIRTDSNSQQLDIIWTARAFINESEDYC
jgi:hypothetical protein